MFERHLWKLVKCLSAQPGNYYKIMQLSNNRGNRMMGLVCGFNSEEIIAVSSWNDYIFILKHMHTFLAMVLIKNKIHYHLLEYIAFLNYCVVKPFHVFKIINMPLNRIQNKNSLSVFLSNFYLIDSYKLLQKYCTWRRKIYFGIYFF